MATLSLRIATTFPSSFLAPLTPLMIVSNSFLLPFLAYRFSSKFRVGGKTLMGLTRVDEVCRRRVAEVDLNVERTLVSVRVPVTATSSLGKATKRSITHGNHGNKYGRLRHTWFSTVNTRESRSPCSPQIDHKTTRTSPDPFPV